MRGSYPKSDQHRQRISATLMGRETMPAVDRFMNKVKVSDSGCWEWTGALKPNGYGIFAIKKNCIQKVFNAHRWIYEYHRGPIPEGLTIDHLCRNRKCVNPDHLEAVSLKVNLLRGNGFSAINARKTTCKRGHVFIPVPEHCKTAARRYCQICNTLAARNRRNRNKGANQGRSTEGVPAGASLPPSAPRLKDDHETQAPNRI